MLFAFNDSATLLVSVGKDNRLKLWDVATSELKGQFLHPRHLLADYSCIATCSVAAGSKKKRKKKKKRLRESSGLQRELVALGSGNGTVELWDVLKGELVHELKKGGHSAGVNDVAFAPGGTKLYSCAEEKHVLEWNLAQGTVSRRLNADKHGVNRVAVSDDGEMLATASSRIRLWNAATGEKLSRLSGHSSPVSCLRFCRGSNFLLSGCDDRVLSLWKCSPEPTPKRTISVPVARMSAQHKPLGLACAPNGEHGLRVLMTSDAGEACIWALDALPDEAESNGGAEPRSAQHADCVLRTNAKIATSAGLLTAAFIPGVSAEALVVAGHSVKPRMLRVRIESGSDDEDDETSVGGTGTLRSVVEIALPQGGALLNSNGASVAASAAVGEVQVLGPTEKGVFPRPRVDSLGGDDAGDQAMPDSELVAQHSSSSDKKLDARSLGERLKGLAAPPPGSLFESSATTVSAAARRSAKARPADVASSLSVVLEQALQSGDNNQLELCLQNRNPKVIDTTVARLATAQVPPLLTQLVKRFETRPSRGSVLLPWVKSVLEHHAALLVTLPDLEVALGKFHQVVESRLGVFKKLMKLTGRLDFVMSQIEHRASGTPGISGITNSEPLCVYDEEINPDHSVPFVPGGVANGIDSADVNPSPKRKRRRKKRPA